MPTFKNIFTYKAIEYDDDDSSTKKFLVCTVLSDGEYFDEIHFDEDYGTLKFYCGDDEIKDNTPYMTKWIVKNID